MFKYLLLILISFSCFSSQAQYDDAWFFLRAKDTLIYPVFQKDGAHLKYTGSDAKLKSILSKYEVFQFKKTFRNASKRNLKKTFFVRTNDPNLMNDLLNGAEHLFEFGELIDQEDKKIFEPNDYGLTSTIGENLGAQHNLDYLDFMGVPRAWYYTVGNPDIIVGIADGFVDTEDIEFAGKTTMYKKSLLVEGHGYSIAEIAIGNGDNAHGVAGICYNCSAATTVYGKFQNFENLMELSKAGARVINCSWGALRYYETAQEAIYEMFENGTIIVAAGHNDSFSKTKGKKFYYPASYDKVIAVSSGMHRYENYQDNILSVEEEDGTIYYANNIRGYVGRNAGFHGTDTLRDPYIYSASIRNLNSEIDILGPSVGIFPYSYSVLKKNYDPPEGSATSAVVPLVTGSIGLMFSLYPCLPTDEVESILKMTAWNIDHIKPNGMYKGMYGAGMLQTGDAVEMVYQLYSEKETAYIQDQNFSRWDFKLTSLSKELHIRNQKFTDSSTLRATAKNRIIIGKDTHLKPDAQGGIYLKIDPSLKKECDLVLRDPSIED